MLARWFRSASDVLFWCSSPIDEIYVRSTIFRCRALGMRVEIAIGGNKQDAKPLLAPHRDLGIRGSAGISLASAALIPCRLLVTASSGLDRSILPTRARKLVHMPHSLASLHMIYPAGAFDGYDVLLAAGPHHEAEFGGIAAARGLADRSAIATGYGKLDVLAQIAECRGQPASERPRVLIAPSWGPDNLLDRCGIALASALAGRNYEVTLRPHPLLFLNRAPVLDEIRTLAARQPLVRLESPFAGDDAIFDADALIGDYSGTGFEFAALRRKPVISVDVGLKVANPEWTRLGLSPVEISCRTLLGPVVKPDVDDIVAATKACIESPPPISDDALSRFLHGKPGSCGARAAARIGQMLSAAAS